VTALERKADIGGEIEIDDFTYVNHNDHYDTVTYRDIR
jgi:hypothetical protein